MDATKLPPPAAAVAPVTPSAVVSDGGSTLPDNALATIGGRFVLDKSASLSTPTGTQSVARDTKEGGAQVAIKIVPASVLPSPAMIDRALRELKQLAKVSSERILKVLDQGRLDDGSVYVATETLPGITLEDLLAAEAPLPLDRACKIVLQIGEALTEAQKVGVIHRDVAPRCVYLDANDQVKVGDFGLAEPVTDKVFGSPAYLSPEQIEGRPVDQRSNIYSLGALLFHALTGKPPFVGDTDSVLQQHQTGSVPSLASARPDLPPETDKLLAKSLEKSGGRRHLTLRQLLTEIEALAARKGTGAPVPAPAAKARPPAATVMGLPEMRPAPARGRVEPDLGGATVQDMPAVAAPIASPTPAPAPSELKTLMADTKPPAPVAAPSPAAEPAKPAAPINASPQVQAAVAAAQAKSQQAKAAAQATKPAGKAGFRETAWFKAGELQEEFDKAAAEAAVASGGDPLARSGTTGEHSVVGGEVDVNKLDVSAQDRARLSLKTGATQAMAVIKAPAAGAVGEQMDEQEMLAEIDSSKKWFIVAGIGIGAAVVAVVLWLVLSKKSDAKVEAPKPTVGVNAPTIPVGTQPVTPSDPGKAPDIKPDAKIDNKKSDAKADKPVVAQGGQALTAAEAAVAANNLSEAVDDLLKARAAGVEAKSEKRVEASLTKALNKQAVLAKKKKDKAKEAEARTLLAKLKKH